MVTSPVSRGRLVWEDMNRVAPLVFPERNKYKRVAEWGFTGVTVKQSTSGTGSKNVSGERVLRACAGYPVRTGNW